MTVRFAAYLPRGRSNEPLFRPDQFGLRKVYRSSELVIYSNSPIIKLRVQAGVIVGHLFPRGEIGPCTELSAESTRKILETRGNALISDYWGGFVSFLQTPSGVFVVRDPSGALPCYYENTPQGTFFASDMDCLYAGRQTNAKIDWEGLTLHLISSEFKRAQTCLAGVEELLAGHRISGSSMVAEPLWSPWRHIHATNASNEETASSLRVSLDTTIDAWGKVFPSIGVSLSGGLDSSIVTAGLRDQADKLTLVNLATDEGEGDERHYARLAASALGRPLMEFFYDGSALSLEESISAYLPRPTFNGLSHLDTMIKKRIASEKSLSAWFTGLGGDNVFCLMSSTTPVLDRLKAEGLTPALKTLSEIMELTGCSIWEALQQISRTSKNFQGRYIWSGDGECLNQDYIDQVSISFSHQWLNAPIGTPIGKTVHVAMLIRAQNAQEGYERNGPTLLNPLLSQPVIEACLAIPTWKWCAGGRNRSMARQAYESLLPSELIKRRSKGGPNSLAYRILCENKQVLRDRLVDGLLIRRGIVDKAAIHAIFETGSPILPKQFLRLAQLVEAENWAQYWS